MPEPAREDADVVIVGAGAAGLATAIFAARGAPGARIVLLDGARAPGAKILVSGGGRCNVTNRVVGERDFWGGSRPVIRRVLRAFPAAAAVELFRELGVPLHEEEHGKLFPDSHQARSVLDALLREVARLGVQLRCGERVGALSAAAAGFVVRSTGRELRAPRVVLATGGLSLPKSGSDGFGLELARRLGHDVVPATPALAPLVLDGDFHRPLSGVACPVELAVRASGEKPLRIAGALLFTHFGVSGPAALDASRHVLRKRLEGRQVELWANLLPGRDEAWADRALVELATNNPHLRLAGALARELPAALAERVLTVLELGPQTPLGRLPREARKRLARALCAWPLAVRDSRGYSFAEVTAGGVALTEVDPASLESRKQPGLHLVGEILDVDGRLGGFNFQWSWSSGFVAGSAIARALGSPAAEPR
ncbi:MAG: NAD(P)/FAD-dependent oxidoreductase [Vicinamibacteria bacterium]